MQVSIKYMRRKAIHSQFSAHKHQVRNEMYHTFNDSVIECQKFNLLFCVTTHVLHFVELVKSSPIVF